jgi:hypothetical protein
MMVYRYTGQPCPHCGHLLDASAGFDDDAEPRAGDVSVCVACRQFSVWVWKEIPPTESMPEDAELVQQKLSPREFNELPGDTRRDLLRAQAQLEELAKREALKGAKH